MLGVWLLAMVFVIVFVMKHENWYRDTYIKKDGTSPLYVYVYVKREKVVFNTGVAVKKSLWDYESESIRRSHPKASDLNLIHNSCRSRINDIFVKYRLQNIELTPQLLRKEYVTPTSYIDFYAFADHVLKSRKNELSEGTYKHHKTFLNKLTEYRAKLMFSEIDREFIVSYTKHLVKFYKNGPGTINHNLNKFKFYLNQAKRQGIIRRNPFDDIKLKKVQANRSFLTEDELRILIAKYHNRDFEEAYHYTILLFLFACFTSLRISDVREFKMEQIIGDILIYFPRKTLNKKAVAVKVPLTKMAKRLIKDAAATRLYGPVFKMPPDQTINRRLKQVMSECGIDKSISFHSARHTFATIFLRRTKNLLALKELLGHSKIDETMIYSHILTEDIVADMKTFDEFI
jgi:integrase/recombinase XerD